MFDTILSMLDINSIEALPIQEKLLLAGLNSHIQTDRVAQRRLTLISILSDGSPHKKEDLFEKVEQELGKNCWGIVKSEALLRDFNVLRNGGIRIEYSRKPSTQGYYLAYPPLSNSANYRIEESPKLLTRAIQNLKPEEKTLRAFAAADFAFKQRKLILQEQHPEWSEEEADKVARQIVYGAEKVD